MKDALLKSGVIKKEDTQEARQAKERRERQQREQEELARRMSDENPLPRWEAPPTGRIVDSNLEAPADAELVCTDCAEPFDPTSAEHKPFGRADQCGPCARGEEPGPRRKKGQMVWTHKTAPTLEIEGGPTLSPEELAAMRRR